MASSILGTHNTYSTEHKEGTPSLLYDPSGIPFPPVLFNVCIERSKLLNHQRFLPTLGLSSIRISGSLLARITSRNPWFSNNTKFPSIFNLSAHECRLPLHLKFRVHHAHELCLSLHSKMVVFSWKEWN